MQPHRQDEGGGGLLSYFIKAGYVENPGPVYFLDDPKATPAGDAVTFQPDVYSFAAWAADFAGLTRIMDVGCGWGEKLEAMHGEHPDWSFVGLDYGANITRCIDTYDWGAWVDTDFEHLAEDALKAYRPDVVICSDVIEHLVNPVPMLRSLRASGAEVVIISTPERDVQYGYDHMGPSRNLCHVREWNAAELKAFLESEGLTVDHIGLTRGNDQTYAMGTILAVCR